MRRNASRVPRIVLVGRCFIGDHLLAIRPEPRWSLSVILDFFVSECWEPRRVQHLQGTRTDDARHGMRRVRARQTEEQAAQDRAHNTIAHQLARADERANRPLLDRFESDPAATLAKFRDSSGATLHKDRAAQCGLSVRQVPYLGGCRPALCGW